MLQSASGLFGKKVEASDGVVGHVHDLLFDEEAWIVRYVVVDTGGWLTDKLFLLSPDAFVFADGRFYLDKTKAEVAGAPPIDSVLPPDVRAAGQPMGEPAFWGGGVFTAGMLSSLPEHITQGANSRYIPQELERRPDISPIHSAKQTSGHRVHATGGDVGHAEDFLVDEDWAVRYMVTDTTDWMPGGHVLVSTLWISDVAHEDATVTVDIAKQTIKDAPPYRPGVDVERADEERLHQHYDRTRYWDA